MRTSPRPHPSLCRAFLALLAFALGLASRPVDAGEPPPAAVLIDPPSRQIELAKELFHEGVARLKAGDTAGALDLFLRSRELVPSYQNTKNAAVCLYYLGRTVEALEMYEELLDRFRDELDPEEQRAVETMVAALRKEIGTLEVTSSAGGRLFVDGEPRAELPLATPLRVPRGEHMIRIEKSGYEPFEITVQVPPGAPIAIRATLRARSSAPAPKPPVRAPLLEPTPAPERIHGGWFVEGYAGYVAGSTLSGDAEQDAGATCADDCPSVGGILLGLRGGYLFDLGLALELGGGGMDLSSAFQRTKTARFGPLPTQVSYRLDEEILVRASFLSAGASYRVPISAHVGVVARLSAGLASARSAHVMSGAASAEGSTPVPAVVTHSDEVLPSTLSFFLPEIGMEATWRGLRVSALLGVALLVSEGPSFQGRQVGVMPDCDVDEGSIGCAPNATIVGRERAYGPSQLWAPQIAVSYTF